MTNVTTYGIIYTTKGASLLKGGNKMYFNNVRDLNELKSQYRKMAFELHPDRGGNAKEFSDMQKEYEALYIRLKMQKAENNEAETETNEETYETSENVDDGFKDIIEIHIKDIII